MSGRKKLAPATTGTDIQIVGRTPDDLAGQEIAAREGGEFATSEQVFGWMQTVMHAGRAQAAIMMATVSDRIIAESYIKAVETRAYVGLPYLDANGEGKRVSSLDEFCQTFFGKGARRCRQIADNYELLGSELFDAAGKVGLGQRDYAALKALPTDDQEAIKQALSVGGDREAVVEMLAQLVERQSVEKGELQADLQAKDDRAAKRESEIEALQKQLRKARNERSRATPDEDLKELRAKASGAALQVRADLGAEGEDTDSLAERFAQLRAQTVEMGLDASEQDQFMAGLIGELLCELRRLRDDMGLPIVSDHGAPDWMQG